jgi:hypothetical protein
LSSGRAGACGARCTPRLRRRPAARAQAQGAACARCTAGCTGAPRSAPRARSRLGSLVRTPCAAVRARVLGLLKSRLACKVAHLGGWVRGRSGRTVTWMSCTRRACPGPMPSSTLAPAAGYSRPITPGPGTRAAAAAADRGEGLQACAAEGCATMPSYGEPRGGTARWCGVHRAPHHLYVHHRRRAPPRAGPAPRPAARAGLRRGGAGAAGGCHSGRQAKRRAGGRPAAPARRAQGRARSRRAGLHGGRRQAFFGAPNTSTALLCFKHRGTPAPRVARRRTQPARRAAGAALNARPAPSALKLKVNV